MGEALKQVFVVAAENYCILTGQILNNYVQLYIVFEDLTIANLFLILHLVVVTRGGLQRGWFDSLPYSSYYFYNMQ